MATRNIVPQAAGEGGIGTAAKPWGKVYADNIFSPAIRRRLLADTTFYVRTDGDDGNNGLTTSAAFATIARALNELKRIDAAGFSVTIRIGEGTWNEQISVSAKYACNYGALNIYGAGASTIINYPAGHGVTFSGLGNINVGGFTVVANHGLTVWGCAANIAIRQPVVFNCPNPCIQSNHNGACINIATTVTLIDNDIFYCVLAAEHGGEIYVGTSSFIFAQGATFISYGVFAIADKNSLIVFGSGNTFEGEFNCQKYLVNGNSLIHTAGGGANYLPGTSAGTVTNGGLYV